MSVKRVPNDKWKGDRLEFWAQTHSNERVRVTVDRTLHMSVPMGVLPSEIERIEHVIREKYTRPEFWYAVRELLIPIIGNTGRSKCVQIMNDGRVSIPAEVTPEEAEWAIRILRRGGGRPVRPTDEDPSV